MENPFEKLMADMLKKKISEQANKGIIKPFEVVIGISFVEGKGIKVSDTLVCNN